MASENWPNRQFGFWLRKRNLVIAAGLGFSVVGCTREYYRVDADRAAERVIASQNCDPRWQSSDLGVYPDPRSRFFDPSDPDRPPTPEDDPTSNKFMQCVYGMHGYKNWYKDGIRSDPQNPDWMNRLPEYTKISPDGRLVLDMDSAVRLARLHNSEYQRNLEEIYLAALDVAFERFQFDVQYAGGNTTTLETSGNLASTTIGQSRPQSVGESSTLLTTASDITASRQFASGAQLLVGFANSFVWQFAGPNTDYAASLANFTLLQPLLRNAGRNVVLEQLTRAERSLLAALRSQAQFRQEFFRAIAVGSNIQVNPRRIGGFQGGAGLSGFTGTGQGGFGGVGEGQNFGNTGAGRTTGTGGGGAAGFAGGGEGNVGGFYGLAQRIQAIRNTQVNLNNQVLTLGLLESLADAGLIDNVQVDEFRQNVETERANLLRAQVSLQDTLEFYLLDMLGIPPTIRIAIDDTLLKPFQFLGPKQLDHQSAANDLLARAGELPQMPTMEQVTALQKDMSALVDEVGQDLEEIAGEYDKSKERLEARGKEIDDQRERQSYLQDIESMRVGLERIRRSLTDIKNRRDTVIRETAPGKEKLALGRTVELIRTTSGLLQEASLYQARVRLELVTVPEVDIDFPTAYLIARLNRLDWMNNRAAFVDQWRLITLNANRLEAFLSLQLDGDVGTHGDNMLRFNGATGTLRARLVFDAPLNRVAERNLYRESLISYQRARRNYIGYIDTVAFSLRSRLRDLQRLRENLEIQRQALVISIRRVDRTLQELNAPFSPPTPGQPPAQLSPVLATNLLRALSDFRSTQDNFTSVYFAYEASRMNLMFLLGVMEIDPNGMFVDRPISEIIAGVRGQVSDECSEGGPILLPEELDYLGVDRSTASDVIQAAFASVAPESAEVERKQADTKLKIASAALMPITDLDTEQGSSDGAQVQLAHNLEAETSTIAPASPANASKATPSQETIAPIQHVEKSVRGKSPQQPTLMGDRIVEWWRQRSNAPGKVVRRYSNDGKALSPDGRKRFIEEMRQVWQMHSRGDSYEQIANTLKMDVRAVRAMVLGAERAQLEGGAVSEKIR